MTGFNISSHQRQLLFIFSACVSTGISILFYYLVYKNQKTELKSSGIITQKEKKPESTVVKAKIIYADISGSIKNPGVYEFKSGARIKDLLEISGGFNLFADKGYFYRNYNLSHILNDQDKIYVPSLTEVESGIFVESPYFIEKSKISPEDTSPKTIQAKKNKVNINTAEETELESLEGIGPATAKKIIQNRPYISTQDLIDKKTLSESLFEKIIDDITL